MVHSPAPAWAWAPRPARPPTRPTCHAVQSQLGPAEPAVLQSLLHLLGARHLWGSSGAAAQVRVRAGADPGDPGMPPRPVGGLPPSTPCSPGNHSQATTARCPALHAVLQAALPCSLCQPGLSSECPLPRCCWSRALACGGGAGTPNWCPHHIQHDRTSHKQAMPGGPQARQCNQTSVSKPHICAPRHCSQTTQSVSKPDICTPRQDSQQRQVIPGRCNQPGTCSPRQQPQRCMAWQAHHCGPQLLQLLLDFRPA